jgi:hypothetical protein
MVKEVKIVYQHSALPVAAGSAAASLPFTGFEPVWMILAGVAIIAVAGAVRRLVPKREA